MTTEPIIEARRTALLLMDFQPEILSHLAGSAAVLENAKIALDWAREHRVQVVFVRVAFAPEDYDAIPHRHKAFGFAKQGRLFPDGDPSLEIDPALEVREGPGGRDHDVRPEVTGPRRLTGR
ncbi:isochorismatase family protein [Amycolatopsis saalfeldensis]|uniref:Isochorismatase family protein n=1 Tax=Amycolatopsis saalfeldensis TaxID=394193 RepID=A0A1H8YHE9_9PSEU|nr:isochorismatase family protein [Amycolatopsis saalfeldensis]SEP51589.1 Isochorismatase family protein [Amycolatopsis saalfeldensis]